MPPENSACPPDGTVEDAVDAAIAACDGDTRAAIRGLILMNDYLEAELDRLGDLISRGFARGKVR